MTSLPWSCDTFAVVGEAGGGTTLVGKNSDRPVRECQVLRRHPARNGSDRLRLAYVELPDVPEPLPHVGSSPYWCWGHEMGVNVHGVTIGNEALFTRDWAAGVAACADGAGPEPGILGMELLRLGLERSDTAEAAVSVITDLLEQYGQWGAGVVSKNRPDAAYDNSFLVADATAVFVLETTGRDWAVRRIEQGPVAISNEPTIRQDWTSLSPTLQKRAEEEGWPGATGRLDVAAAITDPATPLQVSHIRLQRSRQLLAESVDRQEVGFGAARRILSDHYEGTFLAGPAFNPARPDFHTLCMHGHPSGFTWGNTAASMVTQIPAGGQPLMWWNAVTPCTGIYIPVSAAGGALPTTLGAAGAADGTGPNPELAEVDQPLEGSYWWTFQELLEAVAGDNLGEHYEERQPIVRAKLDRLQDEFVAEADTLIGNRARPEDWDALTARCVERAHRAAGELLAGFTG